MDCISSINIKNYIKNLEPSTEQSVFTKAGMMIFLTLLCYNVYSKNRLPFELPPQISGNPQLYYVVPDDVKIKDYFHYMDSVTTFMRSFVAYPLSEHILVRANPWIIDALENTDYYRIKKDKISVYDQSQLVVLRSGDTLFIPEYEEAKQIIQAQKNTFIDINIPEFKLRIVENGDTVCTFPVRVGQNRTRFLKAVGKEIDLRTKTGKGDIAVLHRDIIHIDPVSADTFSHTKRDDGVTTLLPKIPWIEPRINGQLHGQWIHPTTNPRTLGKPYSNGCIGTTEADAWRIYYYAPVGTKVIIRYDLEVTDANGEKKVLKDIYGMDVPEEEQWAE